MTAAQRLVEERARLGVSVVALAQAAGVDRKSVQRWEQGTPVPSDCLARIATLGIDVGFVVLGHRSREIEPGMFHLAEAAIRLAYEQRVGRGPDRPIRSRFVVRLYNAALPRVLPNVDISGVLLNEAEKLLALLADDPSELDRVLLNAPAEERASTAVSASGKGAVAAGRDAVVKGKKR